MKGIVFNIFEDFISKTFDLATYNKVLDESDMSDQVFVGPESYEDTVFLSLVGSAVKLSGLDVNVAVKAFGKFAFSKLVTKLSYITDDYDNPKDLLMDLDRIIHVEVRKLYPGAITPEFSPKLEGDLIVLNYVSKRQLCGFLEGLLEGMEEFYNVNVEVEKASTAESWETTPMHATTAAAIERVYFIFW